MKLFPSLFLIIGLITSPAYASSTNEAALAEDPVAEKRLQELSKELRCLVCQNETIADSNAELAVDLRREIRGLIRDGRSDNEILDFMVTRYGDFVLYRPPVKGITLLLWGGADGTAVDRHPRHAQLSQATQHPGCQCQPAFRR
jgi:cytochrome c-type biogenesis protein CcmH